MQSGWQRLGRRIQRERARQGFVTAEDFARAANLSTRTVEIIESGAHAGRPRDTTLAKIEEALGWQDESCDAILRGGRPKKIRDQRLARIHRSWPQLTDNERDSLAEQAEAYIRQR